MHSTNFFRHCDSKNFCPKFVIPSFMYQIFWYQKFSETPKRFPSKFFLCDEKFLTSFFVILYASPDISRQTNGWLQKFSETPTTSQRQKNFRAKSVIPFLRIKFFDTRNLQKHQRVPLRIFWYCGTKSFSNIFCYTPINISTNFSRPTDGQRRLWAALSLLSLGGALWKWVFQKLSFESAH